MQTCNVVPVVVLHAHMSRNTLGSAQRTAHGLQRAAHITKRKCVCPSWSRLSLPGSRLCLLLRAWAMMGEDGQANECIMNELVWSGQVWSVRCRGPRAGDTEPY